MLAVDIQLGFPGFTLAIAHQFPLSGITVIFGRSGCGKSTLLRVIAGLEPRATGTVVMDETWQGPDRFVPPHRRGVAMVFQDARLFPHLTVAGNLAYAFSRAKGQGGPAIDSVVADFDLAPLLARHPARLSGGERQRVAIARALLSAPRLLLMDEPLAALDATRKSEILPYLERLRDAGSIPILYVSHAIAEVARLANHLVILDQGRLLRAGTAEDVMADPTAVPDLGVREAGAIIRAQVVAHHADKLTELSTSAGHLFLPQVAAAIGSTVRVRIPAHDVMLSLQRPQGISALNILPVTVVSVHHGDGPGVAVALLSGTDKLLARLTRRSTDALGLCAGLACFAVVKSVAVSPGDIGA